MRTIPLASCLLAVALLAGCKKNPDTGSNGRVVPSLNLPLTQVATSAVQWTGVALARDGRLFATFPRMETDTIPYSLAVVNGNQATPFPNVSWNTWDPSMPPQTHFVSVQGLYADANNFLWVLDAASPRMRGVVRGGAKLLKFDPGTGQLAQRVDFDETVATPTSYLNDVRVDAQRNFAYITDSNKGAIVVVNLATGRSRRLLDGDASTKSERLTVIIDGYTWRNQSGALPSVDVDGLALTPAGDYLYYHATTAHSLYRIGTQFLQDEALSAAQVSSHVEFLGNTDPTDGMIYDAKGYLYLTGLTQDAVTRFDLAGQFEIVAQNNQLKWPDSFAIGPDSALYVTTSQLHIPRKQRTEPYRIFKIKLPK